MHEAAPWFPADARSIDERAAAGLRAGAGCCTVHGGMSDTLAKVIIIGIPLAFSLSWFLYWVLKLHNFQKKRKSTVGHLHTRSWACLLPSRLPIDDPPKTLPMAPVLQSPLLLVEDLHFRYPGMTEAPGTQVHCGLTLAVPAAEVSVLFGAADAGKTTLPGSWRAWCPDSRGGPWREGSCSGASTSAARVRSSSSRRSGSSRRIPMSRYS